SALVLVALPLYWLHSALRPERLYVVCYFVIAGAEPCSAGQPRADVSALAFYFRGDSSSLSAPSLSFPDRLQQLRAVPKSSFAGVSPCATDREQRGRRR